MINSLQKILIIIFITFTTGCNFSNNNIHPNVVNHPKWVENANIYEVNIRQFTKEGTFKAFQKHLPRLQKMGVKILWLMPIYPIGLENRKGSLGSYYAVKDYKGINKEFGTPQDLKELINSAHSMGFKVILDWVANHTSWDNKWVTSHPEFYSKSEDGKFIPPKGTDWSDVIDLNYENKELWNYMIDALSFWVTNFDVDGFRCDVADMVPLKFWETARVKLDEIKPVFMLAEAAKPEMQNSAFDMTYNWPLKDIMKEIAEGKKNSISLKNFVNSQQKEYNSNDILMNFTTNHDENSWNGTAYERLGVGAETFAVITHILPGMPLIYNGQEAGLNKALSFFEKDEIEWKKNKLSHVYSSLLGLRKTNKALWISGDSKYTFIESSENEKIFAIQRENGNHKIFACFNLSKEKVSFELKDFSIQDWEKTLISDEDNASFNGNKISLPTWGYAIFSKIN